MAPKTKAERLRIINEVKVKCLENELTDDPATKILFSMLENYYSKGVTYLNKELKIVGKGKSMRGSVPSKFVVNLYNDRHKVDVVLIRPQSLEEVEAPQVQAPIPTPLLKQQQTDVIEINREVSEPFITEVAPELVIPIKKKIEVEHIYTEYHNNHESSDED